MHHYDAIQLPRADAGLIYGSIISATFKKLAGHDAISFDIFGALIDTYFSQFLVHQLAASIRHI